MVKTSSKSSTPMKLFNLLKRGNNESYVKLDDSPPRKNRKGSRCSFTSTGTSSDTVSSLEESCSTLSTEALGDSLSNLDTTGPSSAANNVNKSSILKLTNFVDSPDRKWDMDLLQERLTTYRCHSVLFVDTIPAHNLRRWQFLKTRLCRQFLNKDVRVRFESVLRFTQPMSTAAVVSMLEQVQNDTDIVSFEFEGSLPEDKDTLTVVLSLIGLLAQRDRVWQRIAFHNFFACCKDEEEETQQQCLHILQQASKKFNVPIEFTSSSECTPAAEAPTTSTPTAA